MPTPFDRRTQFTVVLLAASVVLGLAVLRTIDLRSRRAWTLRGADARNRNLAFILSEYIREAFATSDTTLRQLAIHSSRIGGPAAPSSEWMPILTSSLAALSGVGSISVMDTDGIIRHSTQPRIVGQSRRNEYVFDRLAASPADELVVSTPYLSIVEPHVYLIPIGRRLTRSDGTFDGVIVATFVPSQLRDFFRTVDVGQNGVMSVFHPSGFVLFREPAGQSATGLRASGTPLFEAARSPSARPTEGPIEAGGPVFLSGFHQMTSPPLIVAVSRDPNVLLAEWWRDVQLSTAFFLVFGLTTAATVTVLFRQIAARARAEEALVRAERLESEQLQEAHDRLEAALSAEQRARREVERVGYLKDEFLMTVSHELRTPMTAIFGWARLLTDGRMDDAQQRRALQTIARNAQTQTRLIDDLLDVSRVISGKLRLDIRQVNTRHVVAIAIDALKPAADAKELQVVAAIEPAAESIVADPQRLQQILWNLLSNAIKFTPRHGRIDVSMRRVNAHVELAVSDNGGGIARDFLPYVFERFRQEDTGTRRRYGGLGLGLAIVRHLVELHGGQISAESEGEGRGATFRVRLPVRAIEAPVVEAAATARHEPAASGAPAQRLNGVEILIVDDDPEARDLFSAILSGAGARVVTAASVSDALTAMDGGRFSVLVADIEMPDEDGYQLLQRARARRTGDGDGLAAIAVTAHAAPKDRQRAFDAGFLQHVAKPVDPNALVEAVAASMRDSRKG